MLITNKFRNSSKGLLEVQNFSIFNQQIKNRQLLSLYKTIEFWFHIKLKFEAFDINVHCFQLSLHYFQNDNNVSKWIWNFTIAIL